MEVLRTRARGEQVKRLQTLLNAVAPTNKKVSVDGDFGPATLAAVKDFQRSQGLIVDGIVGRKTWNNLITLAEPKKTVSPTAFNPQARLADIAAKYIGVKETGNNLAGDSKALLAIFQADNLAPNGRTDGYPWCAAFVSFCVQALQKQSTYYDALNPPREASVSLFLNQWAKSAGCVTFTNTNQMYKPRKGDIVVFRFSHIGIVESVAGNTLSTIEGNTNDKGSREGEVVARKQRAKSLIKTYIRLPISTTKLTKAIEEIARIC